MSQSLSAELNALAGQLRRWTVEVFPSGLDRFGTRRASGQGAGVIWGADGLIVTNAHVVRGRATQVRLADGRLLEARTIAADRRRDLAALRVEAQNLPAATLGDCEHLRVGEIVLAVGHPLGQIGALSTGILHAHDPDSRWLQADVRLAPGNSGGPMANARGEVIGINTMIAYGLALAIPTRAVTAFLAVHTIHRQGHPEAA